MNFVYLGKHAYFLYNETYAAYLAREFGVIGCDPLCRGPYLIHELVVMGALVYKRVVASLLLKVLRYRSVCDTEASRNLRL